MSVFAVSYELDRGEMADAPLKARASGCISDFLLWPALCGLAELERALPLGGFWIEDDAAAGIRDALVFFLGVTCAFFLIGSRGFLKTPAAEKDCLLGALVTVTSLSGATFAARRVLAGRWACILLALEAQEYSTEGWRAVIGGEVRWRKRCGVGKRTVNEERATADKPSCDSRSDDNRDELLEIVEEGSTSNWRIRTL